MKEGYAEKEGEGGIEKEGVEEEPTYTGIIAVIRW